MAFRLRLLFHGSIALVPSEDKAKVTMLIGKFKAANGLKELVPHVKFPNGSLLEPGARAVKEPPADSIGDKNLRHVLLEDGERLTLNAETVGQPLTLYEPEDPNPTPVQATKFSLKWLPHIAQIEFEDPPTGTIDPALMEFPQKKDDPGRAIVGRMDLDKGLLQTTGILEPLLIDFVAPGRATVTTAVAREAELVLDIKDDRVVIESDSLFGERQQNRDGARDMTFLANGADELVITIGNEPEDEIHQPIPTIRSDDDNDKEVREEFRMLYTMSARKNLVNPRLPKVSGRRPSGNLCVIPVYNSGAGI